MIGENNILVLDVSQISIEDVNILQEAFDKINAKKEKIRAKWIDDWTTKVN